MRHGRFLGWLLAATLVPSAAFAHGGGGALPPELPPSPPGDGATAQEMLRALDAEGAKDPELEKVTVEAVKAVRVALERAHGARAAGDVSHAGMLDGLALEWAQTAQDLRKAASAERAALAVSQKAHDATTRAERARALLEETEARRGRTSAELDRVEASAKESAANARDAEQKRIDAGKGAHPAAPPKSAPKKAKK